MIQRQIISGMFSFKRW